MLLNGGEEEEAGTITGKANQTERIDEIWSNLEQIFWLRSIDSNNSSCK